MMKIEQGLPLVTAIVAIAAAVLGSSILFLEGSTLSSWGQTTADQVNVSIAPGASTLISEAYKPNPVRIGVGQTVVWTNDDSQPHTVTSGSAGAPDQQFDSSPNFNNLLTIGKTFSHTFEKAGEYPYFCQLHPSMVGNVVVADMAAQSFAPSNNNQSPVIQQRTNQQGNDSENQPTLQESKQTYLSAWNRTEFNAAFSTYIEPNSAQGYGIYREHIGGNSFRLGEAMVLYVEPVAFAFKPTMDEFGNNSLFRVNITADYVIADGQGNELQRIEDVPVGDILSHRQNTELFLELTLTQSTPFPQGDYVITYVLHDNGSGETFTITKNVSVAGGSFENSAGLNKQAPALTDTPRTVPDSKEITDNEKNDDSGISDNSDSSRNDNDEVKEEQNSDNNSNDNGSKCDPSYPDVCIPSPPPDLDCGGISEKNFKVRGSDPHRFDRDNDGRGCES